MQRDLATGPKPFSASELGLATLLFAALTIVLAYPMSLHPASLRVDMGPDGDLGWYILSWDTHAFLHRPWAIFDANIYYPDRYTLAYGENIIGLAFFAAPIIWLTGNSALATTLVSLLSCVLCGLGAYVLARRVGLSIAAAVICGIIFECAPTRFFRIGQITLTNIQWIPFALASAHAYFDHGRKRDLRLTAGFVSLQVLSSGHGAVFVTLCLLLLGLFRLLLGEPWHVTKRVRDLGVPGVLLLLPSVLIFLPYRYVQAVVGLKRGLGSWDTEYSWFLASPSDFHRWLYRLFGATDLLNVEVTLFPGGLALVLAVAAVVWRRRRDGAEPGIAASRASRTALFGLEALAIASAAVGVLLTAGAAFGLRIGNLWIIAPRAAHTAWLVFGLTLIIGAVLRRRLSPDTLSRLRKPLLVAAAAMLVVIPLELVRPTLGAGDGLTGEYFATIDWSGRPTIVAPDTRFSPAWMVRRWAGEPPGQFSVRWTGFIFVSDSGTYTFSTTSDDGSQLFIDGIATPVVENSGTHSAQTRSGDVGLRRGPHRIEVRYMQAVGDAAFSMQWGRKGGALSTIPLWALSQAPPPAGRVVAVRMLDWAHALFVAVALLGVSWAIRAWLAGPARGVIVSWAGECRRRPTVFYGLLTLLTFGLSLGPPYGLWQYVYGLPLFNFIRASSRFTLPMLLGLSVLAGIGFDAITRRWTGRRRNWLAAAVGVGLLIEYAAIPMGFTQTRHEIPAVDRWLDGQPKPFVIAEVPARSEQDQVDYMNHSTAHWQKTIQGYHGFRRDFHAQLYEDMYQFPDPRSLERLKEVGVTYVVVHQERYSAEEWRAVEARLQQHASKLRLEHADGAGRVYAVVR